MAKEDKKSLLPKSTLILRLIAGGYLIYLAFELITGLSNTEGAPPWVTIGAAVLFGICGCVLVFGSAKAFVKGNFQGGIMDVQEETK